MAVTAYTPTRAQIDKILSYAKTQLKKRRDADEILSFIELYYSHASAKDLELHRLQDLFGAAMGHRDFMLQRRAKQLKLRVFNPDLKRDGWESTHTIIEVVIDDMPFVVDSMRMELNRMGITIHLMIHMGGMKVARDAQGHLLEVFPYETKVEKAIIESPIYMEIDRQSDPKVLAEIQQNLKPILKDVRAMAQDWPLMKQRLKEMLEELRASKGPTDNDDVLESIAFLEWLLEDHFTFLGVRDYEVVGKGAERAHSSSRSKGLVM